MNPRTVGIESDDLEVFLKLLESLATWTVDEEILVQRAKQVSDWSVGQQIEHLLMADQLNLKAVRLLKMGRGKESTVGLNEAGFAVFSAGLIPFGKATAPDFVLPGAQPQSEELEQLRQDVFEGWKRVAPFLDEIESKGQVISHHAVGELGAWQWLRFARLHTEHHRKIVEKILGSVNTA